MRMADRPDEIAAAVDAPVALAERMLALVWAVAYACAGSRASAARHTRSLLADVDWQGSAARSDGRGLRAELIASMAVRWAGRTPDRFRAAVHRAVLVDEVALLPPDRQALLRSTVVERRRPAEAAGELGLPAAEAARLTRQVVLGLAGAVRRCTG